VVADQPAGWPTPCADFQHRDVLKAQSLGASFWFHLSATRQKDEPVRFSGRNALLCVCSDCQIDVKSATLTRHAARAGLSRRRERLRELPTSFGPACVAGGRSTPLAAVLPERGVSPTSGRGQEHPLTLPFAHAKGRGWDANGATQRNAAEFHPGRAANLSPYFACNPCNFATSASAPTLRI